MSLSWRWGNEPRSDAQGIASLDDILNMPFDELRESIAGGTADWWPSAGARDVTSSQTSHRDVPTMDMNWGIHPSLRFGGGILADFLPEESQVHVRYNPGRASHMPVWRQREQDQQGEQEQIPRGVKRSVLRRQTTRCATSEDEEHQCNICMDSFRRRCRILALPCCHSFCKSCITQWLEKHDTCPVCRWKFPEDQTRQVKA